MADRRQVLRFGAVAAAAPALGGAVASPAFAGAQQHTGAGHRPSKHTTSLVVGHRGASGYRPEHTLASYELAARLGADYLEPDLVSTKDGVLVCRHEPEIGGTTNVASHPEFADRKRTIVLDGVSVTGWWTQDFTLAELKTLRAVERLPGVRQHNTLFDSRFEVPTFQELLDLRKRLSRELGRDLGVIPETKHPTFFRNLGLELETPLVKILRRNGLDRRGARVWIQSFESKNLHALADRHRVEVPLIFLTSASGTPFNDSRTYADYLSPAGLEELSEYVDGVGPDKSQIIPRNADGTLAAPTSLVKDAHHAGLQVIPYTFRAENQFLPAELRVGTDPNAYGRAIDEQITFLRTGIDGLFTDQADIGVLARSLA
ncbi:glycerophosphoryl diester phosphodiesterase [Actinoplanes sp. SE50]|uniref:glycerophosphodiester phosphodiesterase n=1 Tax=unclassified Actinoplanes TaxID=2626549 RepID=UPI00023EBBFB|nr:MULTISPECIES: glycerophosphodiester phosphodiesterase [unclassified Actinoplanes]AEV86242.1 glycerophosphoryl diester phosphodiesterase [Actinoplanes sp. SE50/110]ATO84640.1 glycerophosphoryl diester phosphodiesterase [Actinoplanes sp. SE50]SLM02050.1 glycerophosphoryl diester phosphodiesterase [Actinoplanes sp. SE50/110]